jgi:putative Mn2+ efflux pump MntP
MPLGHWLARHLSTAWSADFAAVMFISIGVMALVNRNPERLDIDQSGSIGFREACFLGLVLSLDSLIAGISAGMLGFTIPTTAVTIAVCCAGLIGSGFFMSKLIRTHLNFNLLSLMPGLIFIGLGLSKLIH